MGASPNRVHGTMLTSKGKYGLNALAHLSLLEPGETTQAVDIADANNIPKKFLDAILADFRNAGIVFARKGQAAVTGSPARPATS